MTPYFHSVTLEKDKCKGCTNCIKRCPTEAIRVRAGKAVILSEKCIDCGECIRTCPNHAKRAMTDGLEILGQFTKVVALPAPSLFGQFPGRNVTVGQIINALLACGFDAVFPVAEAADHVSTATSLYLQECSLRPLISSACPAVVKLIQVRFPELIPHLVKLKAPVEIAAELAKEEMSQRYGLSKEEIGAIFITPCPAKVTEIREGAASGSSVDGAIAINLIYPHLMRVLSTAEENRSVRASWSGFSWGRSGGEAEYLSDLVHVSVAGIHEVIDVLAEVEMGRFDQVDFLECQACPGGCVGGALTVLNPTLTKVNLEETLKRSKLRHRPDRQSVEQMKDLYQKGFYHRQSTIEPHPTTGLDEDLTEAVRKMARMEKVLDSLPGLDCGSCGSPSCEALAEDIVRGLASESDCVFKLREGVQKLAEDLLELARRVPKSLLPAEPES